ncbi:T9SS type A sorting domain-containing protein, partial [bacterium]|nr:T9SS type A sorting domain-containing protein [bacterium]
GDTAAVVYVDNNDATDVALDTALFTDAPRTATVTFYENQGYTDDVDTYLPRNDAVFIEVVDFDQNISPLIRDTVTVTVWVGDHATGVVIDTEVFVLTEFGETTEVFRSDTIAVVDTEYPIISNNGRITAGLGDTLHVHYADPSSPEDTVYDTALIVDAPTASVTAIYEDANYTNNVDTLLTRDVMYVQVTDVDENRNPQSRDTVWVMLYVANATIGGGAAGLIVDTERLTLTESGETTGVFRQDNIMLTDTKFPGVNDGIVSWGMEDTIHVVYEDVNSVDTTSDTALAIEIKTTGTVQFFEDAAFSDDVDTFVPRNDVVYIEVADTDENRNPQTVETVVVTVWVGNDLTGVTLDTEVFILTELGETTGRFRSAAIALVDTEYPIISQNGRLTLGLDDTLHVAYTDSNEVTSTALDTALIVDAPTVSVPQFYEDAAFQDAVDTFIPRNDVIFVQVQDTDENRNPQSIDTVRATLYVGNGAGEGGGIGLVLDTEVLILTEAGETSAMFRSAAIALIDTEYPIVSQNGRLTVGLDDTLALVYGDVNSADTTQDTALIVDAPTVSVIQLYEDAAHTNQVDTYQTRDVLRIQVTDTDENRNPQATDTIRVTVYVGNGTTEGEAASLVLDTATLILTEAGETSAMFRSGDVMLTDTKVPSVTDGIISWGRGDTLHVVYGDVNSADTVSDTALAVEIPSVASIVIYEDAGYLDETDTLLTRDNLYIQVTDTDENRNPQRADTAAVTLYVANATFGGGAIGLVLDTEILILTEAGETSGVLRSGVVTATDTAVPAVNDGVVTWGLSDTLHVVYTDVTGSAESVFDTALAIEIPTVSAVTLYEDVTFADAVDTFLVRNDVIHIELVDLDENANPQSVDTVQVTLYVGDHYTSLILDTETIVLTEISSASGRFRSDTIAVVDTEFPLVSLNARLAAGLGDTLHVAYVDATNPADSAVDTALFVDAPTPSITRIFEDRFFTDETDTLLTRDVVYLELQDTDENRNPQSRDTVIVTVYVGDHATGLLVDTDVFTLTEAGETSGVFRSDTVQLTDTKFPSVNDGIISWGRADTIHVVYGDVNSVDTTSDTALAIEIPTAVRVQLYDDANYSDDVDTFLTRDAMYIQVQDTDENLNPQTKDTVAVTIYVANATSGGGAAGLVDDTEVLTLTETGETTGIFRVGNVMLTDTVVPTVNDGIVSWGRDDTMHVVYTDPTGVTTDMGFDTALAVEIRSASTVQFYENAAFTDPVDTFSARTDVVYIEVADTDENRNPQAIETVTVTIWIGDDATGTALDTEVMILTETGETTGIFRSSAIAIIDTEFPLTSQNGRLALGLGDTLHVAYTDSNDATDVSVDTALVVDVPSASVAEFYEDAAFQDAPDTFLPRNDVVYIQIHDTDENRNPQSRDTVTVTVFVGNGLAEAGGLGLVIDTEVFILTEAGETSAMFRSAAILLADTEYPIQVQNGRLTVGLDDTIHLAYTDSNFAADADFDTIHIVDAPVASVTQIFEDAGYSDEVDTLSTRDVLYAQVMDTDENRNPQAKDTVRVTVFVADHAAGLIIDTEVLILTEGGETTGTFRSGEVVVTDTTVPSVNDGVVSWGRSDTIHVRYEDVNSPDTTSDTALAVEIVTVAQVLFYEDALITDPVDTYLTRDVMYLAVHDTDENLNPQARDTVTVTIYAGNGVSEGVNAGGLVLDTQTLVLTESGETTGVFLSDTITLTDTEFPVVENGRISWGRGDTMHVVYVDQTGVTESVFDTALAIEIPTKTFVQFYEDSGFIDDVDTYLTRDEMYIEVRDTDENRNPQLRDTVLVTVTVGNDTDGQVIDVDTFVLTETSETSGVFRSARIVLTDTVTPVFGDGIVTWGESDTTLVLYVDVTDGSDSATDSALAIVIKTFATVQIYENRFFTDDVDTLFTRDVMYVEVVDTDENRNPQVIETVTLRLHVGNAGDGLVIDTEILILTEAGETAGIFRSDTIVVTDTKFPVSGDGWVSWGLGDTIHLSYVDANDPNDTASDTALAIEISTSETVAFFAFASTDTYLLPDTIGIEVVDLDANQNPQIRDTVIVYISSWNANGTNKILIDTEMQVLTEDSETSGVFRNSPAGLLLSDTIIAARFGNGFLLAGRGDTLLVEYFDMTGIAIGAEAEDTAFVSEDSKPSRVRFLKSGLDTDIYGTSHDSALIEVVDEDRNIEPQDTEVLLVLVQVAQTGDSEYVQLTQVGADSEVWRAMIWISDTLPLTKGDGMLSAANFDTIWVLYQDTEYAPDFSTDTALIHRRTPSSIQFYDSTYESTTETYLPKDYVNIEVVDTDENENPFGRDTITVVIYASDVSSKNIRDTETIVLTETTDTSGIFRSAAITGQDTFFTRTPNNGLLEWAEGDSLHVVYVDDDDAADGSFDTANVKAPGRVVFDDTIYLSIDTVTITVRDFFLNVNPLVQEVVSCTVFSPSLGDTEVIFLTEIGVDSGIFSNDPARVHNGLGMFLRISETAPVVANDGILTVRPGDSIVVQYFSFSDSLTSGDTARIDFAPTASKVFFDRTNYNSNRTLYLTLIDSDQRGYYLNEDTLYVDVYTGGLGGIPADSERVLLTELADATGFFSGIFTNLATLGFPLSSAPGANQDGVLNVGLLDTIFVQWRDPKFVLDVSQDTAIFLPDSSVASVRLVRFPGGLGAEDAKIFAVGDSVFVEVTDTDQNLDPNIPDTITVVINSNKLDGVYRDTKTLVLIETARSSFRFVSPGGLILETGVGASTIEDSVLTTFGLDVILVSFLDTFTNTTEIDTAEVVQPSVQSTGRFTDSTNVSVFSYDVSVHDRLYLEITDTNQNKILALSETVAVNLFIHGAGGIQDSAVVLLTEIDNNDGIFRIPAGVLLRYKEDTNTNPDTFNDGILSFRNGDTVEFVYVDPDTGLDTVSDFVPLYNLQSVIYSFMAFVEPGNGTAAVVVRMLNSTGDSIPNLNQIIARIEILPNGISPSTFDKDTAFFSNGDARFTYNSSADADFNAKITISSVTFMPFIRIRAGQKLWIYSSELYDPPASDTRVSARSTVIFRDGVASGAERVILSNYNRLQNIDPAKAQLLDAASADFVAQVPGRTALGIATENGVRSDVDIRVIDPVTNTDRTNFKPNTFSVIMQYPDDDNDGIVDGTDIRENNMSVYFLKESINRFVIEPTQTVNATANYVEAIVDHLTLFGLFGGRISNNVGDAIVYPNPFKPNSGLGHTQVIFDNIPENSHLRIYDISGQQVDDFYVPVGFNRVGWNATNAHGLSVASGVYIYVIEGPGGRMVGKVMVVK